MSVFSLFLIALLTPTKDAPHAGIWLHYQDTLLITNVGVYYTNADAIKYMCGSMGKVYKTNLVGSCVSGGAHTGLRNDTLFVITSDDVWTPYTKGVISTSTESIPIPIKSESIHKEWAVDNQGP